MFWRILGIGITRIIGPLPTQAELDTILAEVWPESE